MKERFLRGLAFGLGLWLAFTVPSLVAQSWLDGTTAENSSVFGNEVVAAGYLEALADVIRSEINILRSGLQQVSTEANAIHGVSVTAQTLPDRTLAQLKTAICADSKITCN